MTESQMTPALHSLRNDITLIGSYMRDFSAHVIEEEISKYPVYVAFQTDDLPLGKPFFTREQHNLNWNFNATILEEFVKKEIVNMDKVDEFRETYGDPLERACIFVFLPDQAGFVFIPYQEDQGEEEISLNPTFD